MKEKLLTLTKMPFQIFLFITLLTFSNNSVFGENNNCGVLESIEFTNGDSTQAINNNETYSLNDLPNNFYVNVNYDGRVRSVRYNVKNLDTNQEYSITENIKPFTFPAGNSPWNLGEGNFSVKVKLYKYRFGLGQVCDQQTYLFSINSEECTADAGSLHIDADPVILTNGSAMISASHGDAPVIPEGYSFIYVLTSGDDLVIEDVNPESPSFTIDMAGLYTIHTLVYDGNEDSANYLNLGVVDFGTTTGGDVIGIVGAAGLCAALDVAGAPVMVEECTATAGNLHIDASPVTLIDGMATVSASHGEEPFAPEGYTIAYVLTSGEGLVIEQLGGSPSFEVDAAGDYTIHTFVYPSDLDVAGLGVTTGFEVNALLIQGGGTVCAALDVAGAPVMVEECTATAGNLHIDASPVTLIDGMATVSASHGEEPFAPEGYTIAYVLTSGEGLVIEQLGGSPSFEVDAAGDYTIHTFVYPSDLDVAGLGVTTGFEVNALLIQGGGTVCAALDVAGAPVMVEECTATAGNLHIDASPVTLIDGMATVSASHGEEPFAPEGYTIAYVLTSGEGLVIEQLGGSPSFEVDAAGDYTIHTFVYPSDLDVAGLGVTTGFEVNALLIQGGGTVCAALDVAGAPVMVEECTATAGNLHIDASPVTLIDGMATVSASHGEEPFAPEGYTIAYVLTSGEGLVIEQLGGSPSFEVDAAGDYTIHTFVYPSDLDVAGLGVTTGFEVNALLIQGGGTVCAALDVAGAPVMVEECTATAGNLHIDASPVTLIDGMATVSASHGEEPFAPEGYTIAYVLTSGEGLVIEQLGGSPSFEVDAAGDYTIHTFVYPSDLDVAGLGVTTGFEVNALLIQGGGTVCAALDVAGAPVMVEECTATAGNLHIDASPVTLIDGMATVSASHGEEPFAPEGYTIAYVLTSGEGLVIEQLGGSPSFEVDAAGDYTIHTFVYPSDLDVAGLGVTTGFEVNALLIQGGGTVCAALDVAGAPVMVEECTATAGNLHIDASPVTLIDGMATVSASHGEEPFAPEGYTIAYVLTSGEGLVIEQLGGSPSFEVDAAGDYTIHTFVYPSDLDVAGLGVTTGFEVNALLIQGGGTVCAALDVAGAPVMVEECTATAGNLHIDASPVTLIDGMATVSASHGEEPFAPEGYTIAYVLTSGEGLVIEQLGGSPSFEVDAAGDYTIHTFVYPSDLDVAGLGVTTGFEVNALLIQGGGTVCAALDVAGAPVMVEEGESCDAYAGTLKPNNIISCLSGGTSTISAYEYNAPIIPDGYQQIYVLTNAFDLTILEASTTPEFDVDHVGFYRIHSLVYNPDSLDLNIVQFGETTGFDVNGLLQQGGGNICASLDVQGAVFLVLPSWICNWFNYSSYNARGGDPSAEVEGYISQFDNYNAFERSILKDNEPRLYPNPVNDILNVDIRLFDDENMSYTISDLGGRLIQSGSVNEITKLGNTIETGRLSSGTYLISFTSDYRNFVKKIQVSK